MTAGDYLPGGHLAVVEVHGVALLPASTPGEVLGAVRAALGPDEPDGERAAVLLEALTLGTRLSALPPFAAAVLAPGRVDLLVRGPYRVSVTGARPLDVDGLHVTSWREESAEAPTLVEVTGDLEPVGDAEPADGAGRPGLPLALDRGVAYARSVRIALEPAALEAVPTGQGDVVAPAAPHPQEARPARQRRPRAQAGVAGEVTEDEPPVGSSTPGPGEAISREVAEPGASPELPPTGVGPDAPADGQGEAPVAATGDLAPVDDHVADAPRSVLDSRAVSPEATLAMELTRTGETEPVVGLVTGVPAPITAAGHDAESVGETDYGYLWEHTVAQSVEQAAVRATGPDDVPAAAQAEQAGDHDGATIHLSDLLGPAPVPAPAATAGSGVLSRYCAQGHPNAPHTVVCRVCGGPTVGEPRVGPRPALGRVRLSSGETVELDRSVILGRRPRASRVGVGDIPHLVAVGGKEVSRSHLELRVEDWNVLAVELGSRNGTLLLRPGQPPVRLVDNDPVPVRSGDRFDLGEGIVVTAEDVP